MMSFQTISIFSSQPEPGPQPLSFFLSILFHAAMVAVIAFSIAYKPPVRSIVTQHYAVRQLDMRTPDQQKRAANSHVKYPQHQAGAAPLPSQQNPAQRHPSPANLKAKNNQNHPKQLADAGRKSLPHLPVLPQVEQATPGPQTLIQPDLQSSVALPNEIPVPQVLIWSPSNAPANKIVPPLPEKPTSADVNPSLERPNDETNLASTNIASSANPSAKPLVTSGTTSPIAIHIPKTVQLPPVATAQPTAQPTPAAVLSISDLHMKDGTAALPPVNETLASNAQGGDALAQSQPQGQGKNASSQGSGSSNETPGSTPNAASPQNNTATVTSSLGTDSAHPASAPGLGMNESDAPTASQITLPKDGRFSAVVVGQALEDEFPELTSVWSGRMAYTVYLHVGLSRSWILQYSLPRDTEAASAGNVARLEAPWPYNIVRPNLTPGSVQADALMVHAVVNVSGRFEDLQVVFPADYSQTSFVLTALQQWQFRPATQDGQPVKVEVLLIIPEQMQ